jgi:transposase
VTQQPASCSSCAALTAELHAAHEREHVLHREIGELREQLQEALAVVELQRGDLERYKAAYERVRPNTPERVDRNQLQLAFERVLAAHADVPGAEDLAANHDREQKQKSKNPGVTKGKKAPHSRRNLDLTNLPVEECVIDPDGVIAVNGEGYELIGEETSDRVAFRPGSYIRLRITRRKWVKKGGSEAVGSAPRAPQDDEGTPVVIAPVPASVWPSFMADPSAVTEHIINKYGDCLPLHRQEMISARNGFRIPRSTQCGWLGEAFKLLYRIVDAMHLEAVKQAFCIATDATSAPVRIAGGCDNWHVFVFIADQDHVIFRYSAEHSSDAMQGFLHGFMGYLLADAAAIYDILHRAGAVEVGCWFHLRRYFWRAIPSDPTLALEAMALIGALFKIERECRDLPLEEHTAQRAQKARPVLDVLDAWVERHKNEVDPRGPLDKAIGYYSNQRDALHRFLDDGRLRLENNPSEHQLRNVVLGRHNWLYFANETGLKWYTTFRSLIASCALHGLNARDYLEQVLRLAPHWKASRMLELSPKYWKSTLARLSTDQMRILIPPWQQDWPLVEPEPSRLRQDPLCVA